MGFAVNVASCSIVLAELVDTGSLCRTAAAMAVRSVRTAETTGH